MAVSPTLLINQPQHGALPREHLLTPGTLVGDLGRYDVAGIVAVGGMATVYRAIDKRLGIPCAIKALYLPSIDDQSEVEAFRRESQILASLHFPGIVAVRDCFVESDFAFSVMDYIDGQNLYDRHRRTGRFGEDTEGLAIAPVPEDQVVSYALALADALDYMHTREQPIVYRDMKPHNVMRRASDGGIVLLDFGIARRMRARMKHCRSDDLGTPGYAAPEQYETLGFIDGRTDIYSLGVLLVELATGYNPRAPGAAPHPPQFSELPVQISPMLGSILQKCLEIQPRNRYQSARALSDALLRWEQTPRHVRRRPLPAQSWRFHTNARASGTIHAVEGTLFAADTKGALYALETSVGHVHAEQELPSAQRSSSARYAIAASPITDGNSRVKLSLTVNSTKTASLMLFDDNLCPLQRVTSKGRLVSIWSAPDSLALVSSEPGEIAMMTCSSQREWHYAWRTKLNFTASSVGIIKCNPVLLDSSGMVKLYDAATGAVLWEQWVSASSGKRVISSGGESILIWGCKGDTSLTALDAATGKVRWHTPGVGVPLSAPLVTADQHLLIVPTLDAGLSLLDLKHGTMESRIAEFSMPLVGAAHFQPATDVIALAEYGQGARVVLYDVMRQKTIWSEPLGEKGAVAPPVISGDRVIAQEANGCISAWAWGNAR